MSSISRQRILAIAPSTRHLGFAAFDGEELVGFGVKAFEGRGNNEGRLLAKIERSLDRLVERHAPRILAVEEVFYAQASLSPALRRLVVRLKRWGRERGMRVVSFPPTAVKDRLCQGKRTRRTLAEAMVRRFWFLYSFLKPGRTGHYWQQMFDAVALGAVTVDDAKQAEAVRRPKMKGALTPLRAIPSTAVAVR